MELTVLGANGTYPVAGGACSGYLLQHEGFTLWMDAGNGTMARLQDHMSPDQVDAIFLSHAHPDHCADLYPFFYLLLMENRKVPIYTAPRVNECLIPLIGVDTKDAFRKLLSWTDLAPGSVTEVGPFRLEAFDAAHSTPNAIMRFQVGDKVLCYSGDTGPHPDLARAANETDLFLCEASWLDGQGADIGPIHLTAREAGTAAKEAGVSRLMLTHIWPQNDLDTVRAQAADVFDGRIELAVQTARAQV
jgi:ribonuclease BN (tRNA processing enzyme)